MNATDKYLKEHREEIITILTNMLKGMSGVTLKQLMIAFKNEMKRTSNNKTLSYFAASKVPQNFDELEVTYSKPYAESNHAKMVNYYGKEKANQLMNL